jgi:hypothetical protein
MLQLNPDCYSRLRQPQDRNMKEALVDIFCGSSDASTIDLPEIISLNMEGSRVMVKWTIYQNVHQLMETDDGYLGLAPKGTLPGDKIAILKDCPVPMVLRKVENYYVNIGSCYIVGLMEGEAAAWVANGRPIVEQISIRQVISRSI